jgi:hypothetical protein
LYQVCLAKTLVVAELHCGPQKIRPWKHCLGSCASKIDQQAQYCVGSTEFLAVDSTTREKLIESLPKPGEVFDSTRLNEFFNVNRAILPPDASRDDVNVEHDNKMRTVRILFDFRVCPQPSN